MFHRKKSDSVVTENDPYCIEIRLHKKNPYSIEVIKYIDTNRNTQLLGDLGYAPAMKITHSVTACDAVFGHKYHSFSLTCMLTSRPHKKCDRMHSHANN